MTRLDVGLGRDEPQEVLRNTSNLATVCIALSDTTSCLRAESATTMSKPAPQKIGRDAKTGEFIPVKEAQRRPSTAVVETIRKPAPSKPVKK